MSKGDVLDVKSISDLLELAANDDVEGFKVFFDKEPSSINNVGVWYGRQRVSNQMILLLRTPLMIAATYGSFDVLKLILSLPEVDINKSCGVDKTTALHCAASSGSINAVNSVKLLLEAGADPGIADYNGLLPFDVIIVTPKYEDMKYSLEMMLTFEETHNHWVPNFPSSPSVKKAREKKEYPIDPSLPDIKNSIYSTDEFRMFSFKVRPCSRAYSHDWTECPFVHPGENARRRDPRKFHYSCVPCPDFRKGACGRGDLCEYAHGVFECWLHPAHYRTRLCKDGTNCDRRVCFFAHTQEELRSLNFSSGSSIPSPRSIASGSDAEDLINLLRGSFTPPMSPSNSGWSPQQNVPLLHNIQCSRLRSSLNARDVPPEDLSLFDVQQKQLIHELPFLSKIPFSSAENSPQTIPSAAFHQFQQQQQSMLSPIKTNYSQRNIDQSLRRTPFCVPSPRSMEPVSPIIAQAEKQFRSLSSRDLGYNAVEETWSSWGSPEWLVHDNEFSSKLKRSSLEMHNDSECPKLSWAKSVDKSAPLVEGEDQIQQIDQSNLGAWLEQLQFDQLMAQ